MVLITHAVSGQSEMAAYPLPSKGKQKWDFRPKKMPSMCPGHSSLLEESFDPHDPCVWDSHP